MSTDYNQMIRNYLIEQADSRLKDFSLGLIPGSRQMFGVRLPKLRALAKQLAKEDWRNYLIHASDEYMEETMLQGMTIGYVKEEFSVIRPYLDKFVKKIDNWSVCDSCCTTLKYAAREKKELRQYLQQYLESDQEYEIRFAVVMLLDYFITEEYIDDVLVQLDRIEHPGYYVKMAVAWNLAECYIHFPDRTMSYMGSSQLDNWTYNKAIQKMTESYRVTKEEKEILRGMKRPKA